MKRATLTILFLTLAAPAFAYTTTQTVQGFSPSAITVGYEICSASGSVVGAHTTSGITEIGSTGIYVASVTPPDNNQDVIVWDDGNGHYAYAPVSPAQNTVITALPNASPSASGGLLTVGTGTGELNPSGGTLSVSVGNVTVGGYATNEDPGYLIGTRTIDGSITVDGVLTMLIANLAGSGSNSFSAPTLTTTYKRQDGSTTAYTNSTTYAAGVTPPISSRSGSIGTLPN